MPNIVPTSAAAAHRKVDPSTVRNWIRRGWVTAYRMPGGVRLYVDLDLMDAELAALPPGMLRPRPTYPPEARVLDLDDGHADSLAG